MTSKAKALRELEVFRRFASAIDLEITSIEKTSPPKPDIESQLRSGECQAYELVEVIDASFARRLRGAVELERRPRQQRRRPGA